MKTFRFIGMTLLMATFIANFIACSKEEVIEEPPQKPVIKTAFNGYVQKGPYINGSSVTITLLDDQLGQTGTVYSTRIADNSGSFEERNIELISPFAELKADGYYFNEVEGDVSNAPLSLYALADISDTSSVNINILTHLGYPRVKYLVKKEGMSFTNAKKQARKEVLNIFGGNPENDMPSEQLSLNSDAILLTISSIIQGRLNTGKVSELLAGISSDIQTDGKLDNQALGSQLADNVAYLDIDEIQSNLIKKYSELGVEYSITTEDLNKCIQDFNANTDYQRTLFVTYPQMGQYGINLLADEVTTVSDRSDYSLCADVPAGIKLKVIIKGGSRTEKKFRLSVWGGFYVGTQDNWMVSSFNEEIGGNILTSIESGRSCDLKIMLSGEYDIILEYYENGATEPTKVKQVKIKD